MVNKEGERLEIIAEVCCNSLPYVLTSDNRLYKPLGLPALSDPYKNNYAVNFREVPRPIAEVVLADRTTKVEYKDPARVLELRAASG